MGHASSTRSRTTTPSEHHARSPFSARATIRARASPRRRRARPPPPARALTFPSETRKLLALRDELSSRGLGYLLDTWRCDDEARCDPCGPTAGAPDSWGAWHYVACRVLPERERAAEASRPENAVAATKTGDAAATTYFAVTNVHLSDLNIEGTFESLLRGLCPFSHLRELDLDGGRLVGSMPEWLGECFPELQELDLSHNRLEGAIPRAPWRLMPELLQVKLEDNRLSGEIPGELAVLSDLRVLWLDDNDLEGPVPNDLARLSRLLSFNAEDNPRLCGAAPEIAVDWRWHLDNQEGQVRDWFAFCEKDPCGVFAFGGTKVGTPCASVTEKNTERCGKAFDQCGGTVAVRLALDAEWTEERAKRSRRRFLETSILETSDAEILVDVPFQGATCCRRGSACEDVPTTAPCASGSPDACSFRQCVPVRPGTAENREDSRKPKTAVPAAVLAEWRADVARKRGGGGAALACAPAWGQCGGTAGYAGPECCQGAAPCVRVDEWYAACDPTGCAPFGAQCGGERGWSATPGSSFEECCRAGAECAVLSDGYHECVPFDELKRRGMDAWPRDPVSGKLRRAETSGDFFWTDERKGRCVEPREQCGGFAGDDDDENRNAFRTASCCGRDAKCVRKNRWYASCETCAGTYGQCDGAEFSGGKCCVSEGDACVFVDEYYSQCRPTAMSRR